MENSTNRNVIELDDSGFSAWNRTHVIIFLALECVILVVNVSCGIMILCSKRITRRLPNIILASLSLTESVVILQVIPLTLVGRFDADISCTVVLFLYQTGRISVLLHVQLLTLERIIAVFPSTHKTFKFLISSKGRVVSISLSHILAAVLILPIYVIYGAVDIRTRCQISEVFGENEEPAYRYYRLLTCAMLFLIIIEYVALATILKYKLPKIYPGSRSHDSGYNTIYDSNKGSNVINIATIEVKAAMMTPKEETNNRASANIQEEARLSDHEINGYQENRSPSRENHDSDIDTIHPNKCSNQTPAPKRVHIKEEIIPQRGDRKPEPEQNVSVHPEFGARGDNYVVDKRNSREQLNKTTRRSSIANFFKRNKLENPAISTTAAVEPEWRKTVFKSITFIVILTCAVCVPYLVTQILVWIDPSAVNLEQSRVINSIFISSHALLHGIVHLALTTKCSAFCKSCKS